MNTLSQLDTWVFSIVLTGAIFLGLISAFNMFLQICEYRSSRRWRNACEERKLIRWKLDEKTGNTTLVWVDDESPAP